MYGRITITLHALLFIAVIPYLEVSPTHVFNPDWPGHARLHEVWQLIANAAFALLATILAWRYKSIVTALVISLVLSGSFITAYGLQGQYGGTMKHSDGSELLIGGVNPAFGLLLIFSLILSGLLIARLRRQPNSDAPQTR